MLIITTINPLRCLSRAEKPDVWSRVDEVRLIPETLLNDTPCGSVSALCSLRCRERKLGIRA